MKIIILGAGISGLSTYLFLRKHLPDLASHDITIVEAYNTSQLNRNSANIASLLTPSDQPSEGSDTFSSIVVGSALGLSANGLAVLGRIDADGSSKTLDKILSKGHLITNWSIKAARGWQLADVNLVPTDKDASKENGELLGPALMIIRHLLWECLRDAVVDSGGEIATKRVVNVVIGDSSNAKEGRAATLYFSDGSTDSADLVIGADGLKSVVRKVMFEKEKDDGGNDYITPHYEGLCGIGGWLPASVLASTPLEPGIMQLTFGPNGFFGCGYMTSEVSSTDRASPTTQTSQETPKPGLAGWWSTYPSATPQTAQTFDKSSTVSALLARHRTWKNPTISAILAHISSAHSSGEASGLLDTVYPTYTTPPLPTYTTPSGHLVLLGDAAHALQPSSGQGACQALEDAESYSRLLSHYLQQSRSQSHSSSTATTLARAGETFTMLRHPRIMEIYTHSQRMAGMKKEMGVFQEFLVYFFVWIMGFFKDTYNPRLMSYDVPLEVEKIIKAQESTSPS